MQLGMGYAGAGAGAGVKSIMMKKKSCASVLFYLPWLSGSLGSLSLLSLLSGSRIRLVLLFYPALLRIPLP